MEDNDPRSPKRQTLAPSAARAVAALDAAIWTSIVEFLPVPKDLNPDEDKAYDGTVSDISVTWKTLLNLRFVSKELATLLHPVESKALWRRLVLQSFDFSTGVSYNVENFQEDHGIEDPDDGDAEEEWAEQDPQTVAMRGRYDDMPPNYLEEDLVEWPQLGIYHRPSQYGFLTPLQESAEEGSWPESEDAFTLYSDLVRLLQLPRSDNMDTRGEGSGPPFKYLAAPAEAGSSSAFYRSYVMKTLGYVPHFWHWGRGIGDEWKGFTQPETFNARLGDLSLDENDDADGDGDFDDDDELGFPSCSQSETKRLYRHIRQHCQDWRSVCCNEGSDGNTPVFFVGQSKTPPHRWIGYAGEKCWT